MIGLNKNISEYNASTITIQITDACNLNCSYCYQTHKNQNMMSKETGKQIIDLLFKMYDEDNPNMPINNTITAPILFFMGGEPLLNISLIQYLSDYFVEQCKQKNHIWLNNYCFRICTNGTLYFQENFQKYLQQYKNAIHFALSIDGSQEMNDACRAEQGSNFTMILRAFEHYKKLQGYSPQINIVIAPENLSYLHEVYDFLSDIECSDYSLGIISDHKWTLKEAQEYYQQLVILADHMIKKPGLLLQPFNPSYYNTINTQNLGSCTGTSTHGLVFTPEGKAYTCLRFAPCSLDNPNPNFCIGDVNGVYSTPEIIKNSTFLLQVDKISQYTEDCLACPISSGCSKCAAINYMETRQFIDINHNECWMQRAASLATSYFWNMLGHVLEKPERFPIKLDENIALQIISKNEYDFLIELSK